MVWYKLSKNDWVTPFFVTFRSVREKLLVTVSFDHPVALSPSLIKHGNQMENPTYSALPERSAVIVTSQSTGTLRLVRHGILIGQTKCNGASVRTSPPIAKV